MRKLPFPEGCRSCGRPRTTETCYANRKHKDGLQALCKDCDNATRNYRKPRLGRRPCPKCADQGHRVVGRRCSECRRPYEPLPPLHADADRRRESAWAMQIGG